MKSLKMKSLMILVVMFATSIGAQAGILERESAEVAAMSRAAAQRTIQHSVTSARENIDDIFSRKLTGKAMHDQMGAEASALMNAVVSCKQIRGRDACKLAVDESTRNLTQKIDRDQVNKQTGYALLDMLNYIKQSVIEGNGVER